MPAQINLLSATYSDGPAFNTRSQTHQCLSMNPSTSQPDIMPEVSKVPDPTLKSLTADRLELSYRCRKLTFSARGYLNAYQIVKHLSMKWISLHMSRPYSTNTSLIQVKNVLYIDEYFSFCLEILFCVELG